MVIFSFSTQTIYFTLVHGYYNEEESGNNAIDVTRVVVVEVAVVVDIIEIRRIGQIGRPLPPVVRSQPATHTQPSSHLYRI